MTHFCPRCRCEVPTIREERVTVPRVLLLGIFAWLFKKKERNCARCGATTAPVARKIKTPGTYRCEKNGHLMNSNRDYCPIDGSPVRKG